MRSIDDIMKQITNENEMYLGKTAQLSGFSHIDFQDYTSLENKINKQLKDLNINAVFSATQYGFNVDFMEENNE